MADKKINPGLKMGLDLGPVFIFFAIFFWLKDKTFLIGGAEYGGFLVATAALIVMIVVSSLVLWRLTGRLSPMQLATLVLVLVFGGLSIWLNDGRFIKMKPTLLYLLFAGILGFGLLRGKSYLALVMEEMFPLQHEGWMIFTRRFTFFFLGLAVLNEVVWRTMSDQAWVLFKTFGLMAAMFVFILSQNSLFSRYEIEKKDG